MTKYIIELEDDIKYLIINGRADNRCYTLVRPVAELEILNSDYINENFGELQDAAYQKGYDAGIIASSFVDKSDEAYQKGYEEGRKVGIKDGMCEAWEAARKIVADTGHGGFAMGALCEIFGTRSYTYIMNENTAQEAVDKIKAYEHKDSDRIEVGDEVEAAFGTAVVTYCEEETVGYLYSTGTTGFDEPRNVKKTGRHFDIASILEAMRQ